MQSASPFVVGRAATRVSGRNRIEKDADSRAKGIRGVGSQALMKSVLVRSLEALDNIP